MAPSNLISAFTAWSEAQVLRSGSISRYYAATAITEVLSGLVAVTLFVMGFGVMSFIPMVYARVGVLLGAYGWIRRPIMSEAFSPKRMVKVGRWALPQYASSLTGLFSNYGADFIIGAILGPAATGIYRAASRITGAVSDLSVQPVRLIVTTTFAKRLAAGGHARDLWPAASALSLFFALPALGGLTAVADLILPPLFGPTWANLGAIVAILSIGRIFGSVGGVATPFLIAHGRHKILLPVQLVSSLGLLAGLFVFSEYGVKATAIITAVSVSASAITYVGMAYWTAGSAIASSARMMLLAATPGLTSTIAAGVLSRSAISLNPIPLAGIAIGAAITLWLLALIALRRGLTPIMHPLRRD
jgi:O-antigen/teichoic acid export membrane protein